MFVLTFETFTVSALVSSWGFPFLLSSDPGLGPGTDFLVVSPPRIPGWAVLLCRVLTTGVGTGYSLSPDRPSKEGPTVVQSVVTDVPVGAPRTHTALHLLPNRNVTRTSGETGDHVRSRLC